MKKAFIYIIMVLMLVLIFMFEKIYAFRMELAVSSLNMLAFLTGIMVYLSLGIKLLNVFKIKYDDIEKYPYAFAMSSILVSTFVFIIGGFSIPIYKFYIIYIFIFLAGLFTLDEIREMGSDLKKTWDFMYKRKFDFYSGITIFVTGLTFLYIFITALVPPLFYDSLVYHLAVPQQYIAAGSIVDLKGNIYSYLPGLVQMDYLVFMQLAGDIGVNFFQVAFYLAALTLIYKFAKLVQGDANFTLILAATFPLFVLNSLRCVVDVPVAFFTILAVYILMKKPWLAAAKNTMPRGFSVFLGLSLGAIIATKYTGAAVILFTAVYCVFLLRAKRIKTAEFLAICIIPFLLLLPYLVRNIIFTGNPVYPFFTGIFRVSPQMAGEAVNYLKHVHGFGEGQGFFDFLIGPYSMTFDPVKFGGDVISPIFIISILLVLFVKKKNIGMLLWFCLFYYIVWFLTGQVARYFLGPLMLMIVAAGYAIKKTEGKLKYAFFAILILAQMRATVFFVEKYIQPFGIFVATAAEHLTADNVTYYRASQFINAKTRAEAAVLFLGEARSYYCERRVYTNTVFDRMPVLSGLAQEDYGAAINELKEKNIKYVMVNYAELERLKTGGFEDVYALVYSQKFKNFMDNYFTKLYTDGNCDVFELK